MEARDSTARSRHARTAALAVRPRVATPRPVLDPGAWPSAPSLASAPRTDLPAWRRPTFTAGFALGWVLTLFALGTFTAIWLVGMIATTVLLLAEQSTLNPVLLLGFTGILVARGWVGMVQTIRGRLRPRDLSEPAALPDAFWALSPELQRLVRHARSLQIALTDPELSLVDLDREMFEWIASMARLPGADRDVLAERGLEPDGLREELMHSRWSADRARRGSGRRPRWQSPDHRVHALHMLERFERDVLRMGRDPFRGGRSSP